MRVAASDEERSVIGAESSVRDLPGPMRVDTMLEAVTTWLQAVFDEKGRPTRDPTYWLAVNDPLGLACSQIDPPDGSPSDPLHRVYQQDKRVDGVALVSFVSPSGQPELLASVIVRHPENSDLLRAAVHETLDGSLKIGRWYHAL